VEEIRKKRAEAEDAWNCLAESGNLDAAQRLADQLADDQTLHALMNSAKELAVGKAQKAQEDAAFAESRNMAMSLGINPESLPVFSSTACGHRDVPPDGATRASLQED